MSHKPLINGTTYEIDKGKPFMDGTVREIDHGKTLVGGTVYEIKLSSPVTVSLTIPSGCTRKVIIDGTEYTTSGTYVALESIIVEIQGVVSPSSGFAADAHVYLNGVEVAISQGAGGNPLVQYSVTLGNCPNIAIEYKSESSAYQCYITEIPEGHALLTIGYFTTNHYSISVDGVAYSDTTLAVPVGTIVEIEAFDIYGDCKHHDSNVSIYVNDNCVMNNDGGITYSHTVTGDTELSNEMYYNTCHDCYRYYYQYNVYITEE